MLRLCFCLCLAGFVYAQPPASFSASSSQALREQVAELAGRGLLDSAYQVVVAAEQVTSEGEKSLLLGKLSSRGDVAAKAWTGLKATGKKSPEQAEALYLLGQYQYAAGRYHLAIPEFREYIRRYPKGEDADRAAYWMGNACLHLALTQPDRAAYLDTGLVYLARMPARHIPGAYYASLAAECAARLLLAKGESKAADSVLSEAMQYAPAEEMPALLLLRAISLRTQDKPYQNVLSNLTNEFPNSPEGEYLRRVKGQLPKVSAIARASSLAEASQNQTPSQTTSKSTLDSAYTLQIGSFAQRENAESLLAQLSRHGIKAEIETLKRGQQALHVVMVGRFLTAEDAETLGLSKLKPLKVMYQVRRRATER